jgi:hypothetical protein
MNRQLMKYLVVSVAVLPIPAYAQAWGPFGMVPDASRILTDPNYLPLQGELWGYTDYSHTYTVGTNYNYLNEPVTRFHLGTDDIEQHFGYGITDDLEVDATAHYQPDTIRKETTLATGTTTDLASNGFSDPTFGATWRALDQRVFPVTLDVFANYTPDIVGATNAAPGDHGSIASGGQSGVIGAALAEETRDFTIRGAFDANIAGPRTAENLYTGDLERQAEHTDYALTLGTQTRFTDQLSLNVGGAYDLNDNARFTNRATGISYMNHPGNDASVNVALNYHFVPNTVVGSVMYQYDSIANGSSNYGVPVMDSSVRGRSSNLLGVRLSYAMP